MLDKETGLYRKLCRCGNMYLTPYKKSVSCPDCDAKLPNGLNLKRVVGVVSEP